MFLLRSSIRMLLVTTIFCGVLAPHRNTVGLGIYSRSTYAQSRSFKRFLNKYLVML